MVNMADFYRTLGLSRDAGESDVKKAFRRIALECHPDRQSGLKCSISEIHLTSLLSLRPLELRSKYCTAGTQDPHQKSRHRLELDSRQQARHMTLSWMVRSPVQDKLK